ncbi:MAG TPA: 23S rRNA (adenine(2503)-C(2))-methyltransferase RlmN [Gemmatimonadota bacterium]|nr:23S rRNA (adenine(2503)-C(2))-methyltransferase RlmN [Gemmatimonadota bacterium]
MPHKDPDPRVELLGLEPEAAEAHLREFFAAAGAPTYRAGQVLRTLYAGAPAFGAMTNIKLDERDALDRAFSLTRLQEADARVSSDGTVKHLWSLSDGELVESVLIPAAGRTTLCISSQAGCALGCTFCATGFYGLRRNLSAAEIIAQYRESRAWAYANGLPPVNNIVFMGMGEPFANREAVFRALTVLNHGFRFGARRITVSTVGVIPGIEQLARRPEQFRLAVSLHAPTHELRLELVPIERRYPLPDLMKALREFVAVRGKRVTFEYTLIHEVNDSPELADRLGELVGELKPLVNLIPYNPIPYSDYRPSPPAVVAAFRARLERLGVKAEIRWPRGRDIEAACGQLRSAHAGGTETADPD